MCEWRDIETAPREEGKRILVGWSESPDFFSVLMWKTNHRIVRARKLGEDTDGMVDSYFGDLEEYDDYHLAKPKNFPTHWLPVPKCPKT